TATSRYFGETEDLLEKYAWYAKNSRDRTWPVGSKKPNDLGLFDMHGNVWNWCQEKFRNYPQGKGESTYEDTEDTLIINEQDAVLRGGSLYVGAVNVRSANRNSRLPIDRSHVVGFRPARTFAP